MSHFMLPEGCTLTVTGPMMVTLMPQSTPTLAPQQVPMAVPSMVPQATPAATPAMVVAGYAPTYASWGGYAPVPQATPPAIWEGYAPAYQSPQPMPQAPMLVPDKVPTPISQSTPGLDPAVQQMADYLEARARDKMRKQYEQQAAAVVDQVEKEDVA